MLSSHNTASVNMVVLHVASVEFVGRALASDEKDGLEIVFAGKVELTDNKLLVYEYQEYEEDRKKAKPAFQAYLFSISRIKCRPLTSAHGNFYGGVIHIFGVFDRGPLERIALKMGQPQYKPLVAALKASLHKKA